MLIFDEATSALDKANEKIVQEAIDSLKKSLGGNVTTLVIAHRLSTVRDADNIIVMKKGVKAEEGTHEELVKLGGIYAKLNAKDESANKQDEAKQATNPDAAPIDLDLVAQIDPRLLAMAKTSTADGALRPSKDARRPSAMPTIDIDATQEVDPFAKKQMVLANTNLKAENEKIAESLNELIDPKL